jgi:hypothetical protein
MGGRAPLSTMIAFMVPPAPALRRRDDATPENGVESGDRGNFANYAV